MLSGLAERRSIWIWARNQRPFFPTEEARLLFQLVADQQTGQGRSANCSAACRQVGNVGGVGGFTMSFSGGQRDSVPCSCAV